MNEQEEKPKHAGGRPLKYTPITLEEKIDEWLEKIKKDREKESEKGGKSKPLTMQDFCIFASVEETYTSEKDKHKEFSKPIKRLKLICKNDTIQKGLTGEYNAAFAQFVLKNGHDMKDKIETEVKQDTTVHFTFD